MKLAYRLTFCITYGVLCWGCSENKFDNQQFTDFIKKNHYADSVLIDPFYEFMGRSSVTITYTVHLIGGIYKDSAARQSIKANFDKLVIDPEQKSHPENIYQTNFLYHSKDGNPCPIQIEDMKDNTHP